MLLSLQYLRYRDELNEINPIVTEHGAMELHIAVFEQVPRDPNWFYLLSVHCTFFTNKNMSLLFDQWV